MPSVGPVTRTPDGKFTIPKVGGSYSISEIPESQTVSVDIFITSKSNEDSYGRVVGSSLPKPTPTPSPKKTIVCVKGKVSKKVIGKSPKCPKGYKKRDIS